MPHLLTENPVITSLMGHNRQYCLQVLSNQSIDSTDFGHWLAIPSQRLLLVFRHQQCVAIDRYQWVA